MARDLKEWVKEIEVLKRIPSVQYFSLGFMRDPVRAARISSEYFYSPADGVLLYQEEVDPTDEILNIKGIKYSLRHLLQDREFSQRCLVIGIFMTKYDVHVNRIPYSGILSYRRLPPIITRNCSMIDLEKYISEGSVDYNAMGYIFKNERVLNTVFSSLLNYKYYIVQIADRDVNVITPFYKNHQFLTQNTRFSIVRWGSQVDLVLPIDDRFKFDLLVPNLYHVRAGVDPLVKWEYTGKDGLLYKD